MKYLPLSILVLLTLSSVICTAGSPRDTLPCRPVPDVLVSKNLFSLTGGNHSGEFNDLGLNNITWHGAQQSIQILADSAAAGRGTGTEGIGHARVYISESFMNAGLQPLYNGAFSSGFYFRTDDSELLGVNVLGVLPSGTGSKEYVTIGAHYDNLGTLGGNVYYGADSNASGTAALIELAKAFGALYKGGWRPEKNIIFAAFDAKCYNMAGSREFMYSWEMPAKNITCMINLDQIGSTLVPPGESKNYMLVLGAENFSGIKRKLDFLNSVYNIGLDLDYTFYGSKDFYRIFSKLSDQKSFADYGIPWLYFTSGITELTNKVTDTERYISYPALLLRAKLIYLLVSQEVL